MKRGGARGCGALAAMSIGALAACSFYGIRPPPQNWTPSDGMPRCDFWSPLPTLDGSVGYPLAVYGGVGTLLGLGAAVAADDDGEGKESLGYGSIFATLGAAGAIWVWASREGSARTRKCRRLGREYSAYYEQERPRRAAAEPLDQCAWLLREWQAASADQKSRIQAMMPTNCHPGPDH